jgi:hypothetical protein
MTLEEICNLQPGDEVYWNDPDDGLCSDYYVISKVWVEDDGSWWRIMDADGRDIEGFPHELEWA